MVRRVDFVSMVRNAEEAGMMLDFLIYRFKKGLASLILVVGARGTGKSSTCYRLSEMYNEILNPIREKMNVNKKEFGKLVDSHLGLVEFVKNAQMGDDCVLEEISVLYPSRRSMSNDSVGVSQIFDIIRKKRLVIYANTPMALAADKNIRSSANAMVQTYKIIKQEQVVLSRFWKLQPNFLSGKIYMHGFKKHGKKVDFMYTKMPNKDSWKEYEIRKDNFIDETYAKLLRKAELKNEKDLKELGYGKLQRKPLTDKQKRVMELLVDHNTIETAKILGLSQGNISSQKILAQKKGYTVEEFKKKIQIEPIQVYVDSFPEKTPNILKIIQ